MSNGLQGGFMDDDADRAERLRVRLRWLAGCSAAAVVVVTGLFAYGAIVGSPVMMTATAGVFAAVVTGWSSCHASLTTQLDLIAAQADSLIAAPALFSATLIDRRPDRRPDVKSFPVS